MITSPVFAASWLWNLGSYLAIDTWGTYFLVVECQRVTTRF
jgi:hypothetical protein